MIKVFFLLCLSQAEIGETEVIDEVLGQFPAVQMARQEARAAEGQKLGAEGAFDFTLESSWLKGDGDYPYDYSDTKLKKPTSLFGLDLYAGYRKSDGLVPVYYGERETLSGGEWNFGASLPLLRGFLVDSRRAGLKISELQVQRKSLDLRATELKEIETALYVYWNWKMAVEKWKIQKNLLEAATLRDEWLTKRSRSGDIAEFERQDNLRTVLQRQSALLSAEQELRTKEAQFSVYLTNPNLIANLRAAATDHEPKEWRWEVPAHVSTLQRPASELMEQALGKRPEFTALAVQLQQLETDKRLQSNRLLPQLDFRTEFSQDRGVGGPKLGGENTSVGLQFQMPLQLRAARGMAQQASAKIESLNQETKLFKKRWEADLLALQKSLEVALKRKDLAQQELELANKLQRGEFVRFKQGDANVLVINLREQAAAEASLRLIETTVDVLKSYASLELRIGNVPFK